jgi:glycosyltransferase involved in cell wall biosynthesis
MRVALISPPYIPVPPVRYGGTELFIAHLASAIKASGIDVVVYANGDSQPDCELRFLYKSSDWPPPEEPNIYKDLNHGSWAVQDAIQTCDIIHLNSAPSLAFNRFIPQPIVYTIHHPYDEQLQHWYSQNAEVHFVAISDYQRDQLQLPDCRTIHHGLDMRQYTFQARKQPYLSFLGRIVPEKGLHLAIEVARQTGIPLKIAGEVQPAYQDYYDNRIKPEIDGRLIEYLGEADHSVKNELLANSKAFLFPIQWNEPFGLVMIEAMACGTPVIALPGGAVAEVVKNGVSGYICSGVNDMVQRVQNIDLDPQQIRRYAEEHFSVARMADDYLRLYNQILPRKTPESLDPLSKIGEAIA